VLTRERKPVIYPFHGRPQPHMKYNILSSSGKQENFPDTKHFPFFTPSPPPGKLLSEALSKKNFCRQL